MTNAHRMGRIEFLNVLPIYHAMESGLTPHGFDLVYAPPSSLNAMMERGEITVSSTSCIEYARRPERYWVIPNLSIASHGTVLSVLLVSRVPVEKLEGKTVLLTAESHTSVALVKMLLREYARVSVNFVTGNASERMREANAPEAMLVIGDEALRLRNHPEYTYVWDLGEEWMRWTKHPFVFGLWVASKTAAFTEDPANALHASRDWGVENRADIIAIAEKRYGMSREFLEEYFTCLRYELGDAEREGLRLFYDRLASSGEIAKAPELAFWPGI
ncbi:MAG: Chorismate dehydratase [Desulfovibrio sp.]